MQFILLHLFVHNLHAKHSNNFAFQVTKMTILSPKFGIEELIY